MFIKKSPNPNGRIYLSIARAYRDENKKPRAEIIKKLGYLDDLQKEFEDPISHFREIAKQMEKEQQEQQLVHVTIDMNERLEKGTNSLQNYGHVVFSSIYHELELNRFFRNKQRNEKFKYDSNSIMKLLVYARLICPDSKKGSFEEKEMFFDKTNFSLNDVYNSLTHFNKLSKEFQLFLHNQIQKTYGRNTDLIYYDVTNYYFETQNQDSLRKLGANKEKKKKPIVQMGLAIDKNNIPIGYRLFSGNTHDSQTLIPILSEIKSTYSVKRVIVVADKGLNSGDNIAFNTVLKDGYIYSQKIRGANKDLQSFVLDPTGYVNYGDSFKMKSRTIPVNIQISVERGKKKTVKNLSQKQVIFYSERYAQRAKHQREEILSKAVDLIANPSKYNRATSYGAAAYIRNIEFNNDTGEIVSITKNLCIDEEKIAEEAMFDGYYALITSELDMSDEKIIETYRGLWRIEESFKITKSQLNARPVFVWNEEHVNAHFLICFIALTLLRILEFKLNHTFCASKLLETIRSITCCRDEENLFRFHYFDDIAEELEKVFNVVFGKKRMTLGEIKKIFASTKK